MDRTEPFGDRALTFTLPGAGMIDWMFPELDFKATVFDVPFNLISPLTVTTSSCDDSGILTLKWTTVGGSLGA
jgi:hypothetical protein